MSILDLYGIKEVADVVFWDIDTGTPVLYLDTLKVSTIEETADQTEARGGKGNPPLIIWDYGKEITLTLEDALFSMKSLSVMHRPNVDLNDSNAAYTTSVASVSRAGKFTATANGSSGIPANISSLNATLYNENGVETTGASVIEGERYLYTYDFAVDPAVSEQIVVTSEDFPGTYKITGDTYARSQKTGKDEFFQFEIPQAKINPEQTITMQADGDPSTFSMTVRVLRPEDGKMMKLIKYSAATT